MSLTMVKERPNTEDKKEIISMIRHYRNKVLSNFTLKQFHMEVLKVDLYELDDEELDRTHRWFKFLAERVLFR